MRYILIHGLGQSFSSWDKTISCMGEKFHADCPDVTRLLDGKEPTYNNLYRAFFEYCQEAAEPVCLCGLSMGAILALNYALDQPEKVQSMILIGAQYKIPKGLLRLQNTIFRFLPQASFQKLGFSKNSFIQLSKSFITLDFSNRIADIRCDTLILCGEKDKANKKAARELTDHIPEAEFRTVKGAGHEVNVDAPEALASILIEFWGEKQSG